MCVTLNKQHLVASPSAQRDQWRWLGWIPGFEIAITFSCERFSYFENLEMIQWIIPIPGIWKFWSNSLGIRFWNFGWNFGIAWVAPICVGVSFPKWPNEYIFLHWSFWSIKLRVLVRFHVNPRNFHPRKIHFWPIFWSKLYNRNRSTHKISIKLFEIHQRIF